MEHVAYSRKSRAINAQIDRELAEKRNVRRIRCDGRMRNGPEKRYARCIKCGAIDYELNEGDRCRAFVLEVNNVSNQEK